MRLEGDCNSGRAGALKERSQAFENFLSVVLPVPGIAAYSGVDRRMARPVEGNAQLDRFADALAAGLQNPVVDPDQRGMAGDRRQAETKIVEQRGNFPDRGWIQVFDSGGPSRQNGQFDARKSG